MPKNEVNKEIDKIVSDLFGRAFGDKIKEAHFYIDNDTEDVYIFTGKQLVKIGNLKKEQNKSPKIGDKGDEEIQKKEEEERQAQIEKEKEEFGDDEAEETEEERQQRLDDIKNALSDEDIQKQIEDETEAKTLSKERARELRKKKAADEKEIKKFSSPIQRFRDSLRKFIAAQVKREKNKTWKQADMRYEGSGIMRRGKVMNEKTKIPKINVYFDQSLSWGPDDVRIGQEAIGVLNNYVKRGEITIDVYYFANHIYSNPNSARHEGGTGAGIELLDHIRTTKPDNVIIMTDSDLGRQRDLSSESVVRVPGAVWFLFRDVEDIPLQSKLKGRQQTKKIMI